MTFTSQEAIELIEQKDRQIAELLRQLEASQRTVNVLKNQVEQLLRRVYGRRSEKMDPGQLMLECMRPEHAEQTCAVEPLTELPESAPKTRMKGSKRNHPGRIPIPEHLERVEILLDLPPQEKVCPETGQPLKEIGCEVSEKLEYRPGKLIVNVYKRPKYASPDNSADTGVMVAPMPDHPIERCKADVGLLAYIIVSKFCDHLPLYRQNGIFEREGVHIPTATQSSWVMQLYEVLRILWDALKAVVLDTNVIFTDDSIIPLQVKGNGRVKKARLWVYVRGGPGPPLTIFDFSLDRSKQRPLDFLASYQGYVHADAYSGYDELFRREEVTEVACWAHARRKFDEAASSRPEEASEIIARIAKLYLIEKQCVDLDPEARADFRQRGAAPVLDAIFERLEELKAETIPSEPLRKAVDYTLNQEDALRRYLENGWLKPDNNTSENSIRPLALGRKNWLFAGSERGARAAALFLSLMQSCKACDVNPWEYLNDVLCRIMSHPANRLRELLPDQWQPLPKDEHGSIISDRS